MSAVLALLAALPGLACQESAAPPSPAPIELVLDGGVFGPEEPLRGDAFTILASDADLDGDPDLLVNWHVFAPPVLLWNQGGRFARDAAHPAWSLPEDERVPLLDAARRPMVAAIAAREQEGVHLWHSDQKPFWFFVFVGRAPAAGAVLEVETNRPIRAVMNLEESARELHERSVRIPLTAELSRKTFYVATQEVGIELRARIEGAELPFFVGPDFRELESPVALWYRDPHGMAWVDATGDDRPELYVTRGALRGGLGPPDAPKADDLYVPGADGALGRVAVPGDYGRGRAAQWIDLEGDGRLELYVSAKSSANRLLRYDPEAGTVRDVAHELGLDFRDADSFAWLDLDGDGDEDLITLDARNALRAMRNDGARRFEPLAADALGLRLAPLGESESPEAGTEGPENQEELVDVTRGIDQHDLVLLDLENDGDLDLLVTGWGPDGRCVLYRAMDGRFVEDTRAAGLDGLVGVSQVVVVDLDGDGWLDLLALGREPRLLRNLHGELAPVPLAGAWAVLGAQVGVPCDVDGDGRLDVVLAGRALTLARNTTSQAGGWVWLDVKRGHGGVPIGARVRAIYADGSVQLSRVGSTHRAHLSQSHGPIPLADPNANPLRGVEVLFPGGERQRVDVSAPGALTIRSER